ncbi:hypothetical protein GCM10022225_36020 [Plantactinospora mayteni]
MNRRAVLYGLAGAAGTLSGAAGPLADRLESLRRGVDREMDSDTTNADVDEWERVAFEHAHEVGLLSPERVLPELVADLDEVQARLLRASGDLRVGLARVCGQLSALIAITLLNLDNAQPARRYWRTAIRAVDSTADRNLQSLIRGRRAVYALYDQRSASTVLALADEAVGASQGIVCAGTVSGQAARTQALALLGRHDEARAALRQLFTLFAQLPQDTTTDRRSQWGWSEQRLRHVESHVHSCAGRTSDATSAQDAALSLYPPRAYQGPTQIELHRAICLIAAGDPSEGARHVVRIVGALPDPLRRDALVRRTAALALDVVPASAAKLPAVSEAHELLALPIGMP